MLLLLFSLYTFILAASQMKRSEATECLNNSNQLLNAQNGGTFGNFQNEIAPLLLYSNDHTCSWTIFNQNSSKIIKVQMEWFDLECGYGKYTLI